MLMKWLTLLQQDKDFETFFRNDESRNLIDELDKHTNGRMREWINKITPKQQTQQRKFGL